MLLSAVLISQSARACLSCSPAFWERLLRQCGTSATQALHWACPRISTQVLSFDAPEAWIAQVSALAVEGSQPPAATLMD
jgi:hypothetical protein